MLILLEDKTTFRIIREYPNEKLQRTNNNIQVELLKKEHITVAEKIKTTSQRNKENLSLRPISSSILWLNTLAVY